MPLLAILAPLVAAAALLVAPAGHAVVACGRVTTVPFGSSRALAYSVRIVKGNLSCRTARRVMRMFLAKSASPRGWFCVRGHASEGQKWAAACGTARGADVKAFGPIRT